jgi:hypothetical protein
VRDLGAENHLSVAVRWLVAEWLLAGRGSCSFHRSRFGTG